MVDRGTTLSHTQQKVLHVMLGSALNIFAAFAVFIVFESGLDLVGFLVLIVWIPMVSCPHMLPGQVFGQYWFFFSTRQPRLTSSCRHFYFSGKTFKDYWIWVEVSSSAGLLHWWSPSHVQAGKGIMWRGVLDETGNWKIMRYVHNQRTRSFSVLGILYTTITFF